MIMQVFQDFCDDHFTCLIVMTRMMSVGKGAGVIKQNGGLKMNADGCSPVAAVSPSSSFETGPTNGASLVLVKSASIEIGEGVGGGLTPATSTLGEGISSELLLPQAQPATDCPDPSTQDDAGAADGGTPEFGDGGTTGFIGEKVDSLSKQALGSLLDELTGELVALEDFDRDVDVEFYRRYWFGSHLEDSLLAIEEEHRQKGKCTFHVDGVGKLLDDPDKFLLAKDNGVAITLCVHRGQTEDDQNIADILRPQFCNRVLTTEERRKLRNEWIEVQLRLGAGYESIAKMAGVCPQTVRNVETRAAAECNSKIGFTKRPDGRFNASTLEKIAEAGRLRAEGKDNP